MSQRGAGNGERAQPAAATRASDFQSVARLVQEAPARKASRLDLHGCAQAAGLSPGELRSLFQRWAGAPPEAILPLLEQNATREILRRSRARLAAGEIGAASPFRPHGFAITVHATPLVQANDHRSAPPLRFGFYESPFGRCLIAFTQHGVCALSFVDHRRAESLLGRLRSAWPHTRCSAAPDAAAELGSRIFSPYRSARLQTEHQIETQARRDSAEEPVSLHLVGSRFQLAVWDALLRIPRGDILCYEDIAAAIGDQAACRAVGNAVGRNPVAFLVPCHRVIRKSGAFGNYGGGPDRKLAMLAWDAVV